MLYYIIFTGEQNVNFLLKINKFLLPLTGGNGKIEYNNIKMVGGWYEPYSGKDFLRSEG